MKPIEAFEQFLSSNQGKSSMNDLDLAELNKLLESFSDKYNHTPQEDFDGLSPDQMTNLLYKSFEKDGILTLQPAVENSFKDVPILILTDILLENICAMGSVKLTSKGNLPVSLCKILLEKNLIQWQYMFNLKRAIEDEIPYITPIKYFLLTQGIVKKRNNTLSPTKKGSRYHLESPTERFKNLLLFFTQKLHWGNLYHINDDGHFGQKGWAFSLYLLSKYGNKSREGHFYSSRLMHAFETNLTQDPEINQTELTYDFHNAYEYRFMECFAYWFGLVEKKWEKDPVVSFRENLFVQKSALFDQLFSVQLK